jgi:hypothetical protein
MLMRVKRYLRYWPSLLAFALIAVGTVIWVNAGSSSVDSLDRLPTVVATSQVELGLDRAELLNSVEIRDLEIVARPEGALSTLAEIPDGVLVATHVAGQAILRSSVAPNRVAALGPGYMAVSVRLDPQRWVGPILLTGRTVDIYDIDPEGPRLISPDAVVVESVSPSSVDPKQETILSLGVRNDTLAAVLVAASENRIWLVGE